MNDRSVFRAIQRLERVVAQRPELARLGKATRDLLERLFAGDQCGIALAWPRPVKLLACQPPLFRSAELTFDHPGILSNRWLALCELLADAGAGSSACDLAAVVTQGTLDPAAQLRHVLVSGLPPYLEELQRLQLNASLGLSVLRICSLPSLAAIVADCGDYLRHYGANHGLCPMCGLNPLLSEWRGLEQQRWLRCGWCAAEWSCARICCVSCGQRDHRYLRDLTVDGQEQRYWLSVCDRCGFALPGLATLDRLTLPELLVAEVETLHLRLIGDHGRRGWERDQE